MNKKTALITGIAGQDGSYLAELLLSKGYEVHGIVRMAAMNDSNIKLSRLNAVLSQIQLHTGSLDNLHSIQKIVSSVQPDECYHLGASSFVSHSFDDEVSILNGNFNGTHCILSALKECAPQCRFYFAGSSEMFGDASEYPQNEGTPYNPRSVYGISKVASYHLVRNYREKYGVFACVGILYNHESPRRGFEFVTRKITATAAKIKLGMENGLTLGTLEPLRDWGYAPDYVRAMWLMLQQEVCDDYVIATGITHSVREFVDLAFKSVGLDYQDFVQFDQRFFRAPEKVTLVGDSSKARAKLQWEPSLDFKGIVSEMVESDLALFSRSNA